MSKPSKALEAAMKELSSMAPELPYIDTIVSACILAFLEEAGIWADEQETVGLECRTLDLLKLQAGGES